MPFSQEDIAQLIEALKPAVIEAANTAAAAHVTNRNKSWEAKLEERLSKLTPQAPETETEPEKVTLTQRMVKLEQDLKKSQDSLRAEKEQGHRNSMKMSLNQFLLKNKVPEHLVKPLSAQLLYEDKLVDINKEGQPIFRGSSEDDEMSMEDGLSTWLKGDGKAFLQQPKVSGPGLKNTKVNSRPAADQPSQDEMDELLVQLVRDAGH